MAARRSLFAWPGRNLLAYVFGQGPQQTGGEPIAIAAVVVDGDGNPTGIEGNPSRVAGTLDQGAPGTQPWPVEQATSPWGVAVADGANLDAFSRLRVGLPTLRFSALTDVGKRPLHFVEQLTAGGTSTYVTAAGTTTLTVSTSVRPIRLRVLNEDADPVRVRLVENPIVAGTPVWKTAGDDSAVEFSRSIGGVTVDADGDVTSTGAIVLADVWLSGTGGGSSSDQGLVFDLGDVLPLSADVAGVADTLWIVCNMSTGTGNVRASLAFEEIR